MLLSILFTYIFLILKDSNSYGFFDQIGGRIMLRTSKRRIIINRTAI